MTFCVGLTGGIGCGKSKAADMFGELGAGIIDTDAISHELTGSGGKAVSAIERELGPEYVRSDGSLDRTATRELVFRDDQAKRKLEAILHPMIGAEVRARVAATSAPYVILVVPLLVETGSYRDLLDRIVVVDCPEEQQIARTIARSQLTEDAVRAIIAAQVPRAKRLEHADDVLPNDADVATLRRRVEALHTRYMEAAKAKARG